MSSIKEQILESPIGYALWSAPLNRQKMRAISKLLNTLDSSYQKVLDIGCGPGVNSELFSNFDYLGVDINSEYIDSAAQKFPNLKFKAMDATQLNIDEPFDVILINSFLHHINDNDCRVLIEKTLKLLSSNGVIIIQEPLIPKPNQKVMNLMMKQDRGDYFRHLEDWQKIFLGSGAKIKFEEFYSMHFLGLKGWAMYSALLSKVG